MCDKEEKRRGERSGRINKGFVATTSDTNTQHLSHSMQRHRDCNSFRIVGMSEFMYGKKILTYYAELVSGIGPIFLCAALD